MPSITFDTLKFVERLKDAGIPEAQAKAIAEAFREAQGEAELATKHDIGGESVVIRNLLGLGSAARKAGARTGLTWLIRAEHCEVLYDQPN